MTESPQGYMGTQEDVVVARIAAFLVDHLLAGLAGGLVGFGFGFLWGSLPAVLFGAVLGIGGYFVVLEGLFGKTAGKKLAGVVVVGLDGAPITFRQSLVRNLLRVVDGLFGYAVGFVVLLINEEPQRMGDQVAGTLVVRARGR